MLLAVAAFGLGIVLANSVWRAPWLLVAGIVAAGSLTVFSLRFALRMALLPLAVAWMLAGMLAFGIAPSADPQTALIAHADMLQRRVAGHVIRISQRQEPATHEVRTEIDLALDHVEEITPDTSRMLPLSGGLRAAFYTSSTAAPAFHCGEPLAFTARMHVAEEFRDPGAFNQRVYLLQQGIGALALADPASIEHLPGKSTRPLRCFAHAAQVWAGRRLDALAARSTASTWLPASLRMRQEDADLIATSVFGDRDRLDHSLRTSLSRTGSFHLMVVSGLHIGLLVGALYFFARRFRLGEPAASALALAGAVPYAFLTGMGIPVERALFMLALGLAARAMYRQKGLLNALAVSALALLVLSPPALFESAFQMTFLAVAAIVGVVAPLLERRVGPAIRGTHLVHIHALDASLTPAVAQMRITLRLFANALRPLLGRRLALSVVACTTRLVLRGYELFLLTLMVEIALVLPMAAYFHRITLLAVPANLLTVPVLALLLPAAMLTFLLALLSPALALLPASVTAALLHLNLSIVGLASHLPFAELRTPAPTLAALLLSLAALSLALLLSGRSRKSAVTAILAMTAAAILSIALGHPHLQRNALEISAIDVGQGDSIFVASPQGRTLLVDAGGPVGSTGPGRSQSKFDIGEEVVSPYLWSRRIRHLDAIALTHAHSDHLGGMAAVLNNFHPAELWVGNNPPVPDYQNLLQAAAASHVLVRQLHAGDAFSFGGAWVQVLAPAADYVPAARAGNNDSLVLRISYGATSALLEGDAEWPSEGRMTAAGGLASTLLKVGHHGSITSTTPSFLAGVAPAYAVISDGRHNTFGHPRAETLARLEAANVRTFRTDTMGATSFLLDGRTVTALPAP